MSTCKLGLDSGLFQAVTGVPTLKHLAQELLEHLLALHGLPQAQKDVFRETKQGLDPLGQFASFSLANPTK